MRPVTQVINDKHMTAGPADGTLPVLADRIMVDNAPVKTAFTTGIERLGDVRGQVSPQPSAYWARPRVASAGVSPALRQAA